MLNGGYPSSKDAARTIYLLNVNRDDDAFARRIRRVAGRRGWLEGGGGSRVVKSLELSATLQTDVEAFRRRAFRC